MAVGEVINTTSELMPEILFEIGELATWLQAIGVVILLWIIFNVVYLLISLKKNKYLKQIQKDIKRLERKINKLSNH